MARWRQAVELGMTDEEIGTLAAIARSRSEAARRVERARIQPFCKAGPAVRRVWLFVPARAAYSHSASVSRR
jgi:hypothetical protein